MNQAQQQAAHSQAAAQQAALRQKLAADQKKKALYKKIIAAVVAVVLILVVAFVYNTRFVNSGIKGGQYQAVFLANGQVYFGKLSNPNAKYLTLKDVYYLQVQNNQQESQDPNQQLQQGEPQLIKLGEELHGPEDEMKILQTQVTFWENLKNDSKVVQAINQYKNK